MIVASALLELEPGTCPRSPAGHDDVIAAIPGLRVVERVVPNDHSERRTRVRVGIPGIKRSVCVAVVTHEPRKLMAAFDAVLGVVEAVVAVLPVGDERCHVVVHGQIRVGVDFTPDPRQIPVAIVPRVGDLREIHGRGRREDEEVSHAGLVIHIPVLRAAKPDSVVPPATHVVGLAWISGKHELRLPIGVYVKDRDVGVLGGSIVEAYPVAGVEERVFAPVEPHTGVDRWLARLEFRVVLLGAQDRRLPKCDQRNDGAEHGEPVMGAHPHS